MAGNKHEYTASIYDKSVFLFLDCDIFCPLDRFKEIYKDSMPEDVKKLCGLDNPIIVALKSKFKL